MRRVHWDGPRDRHIGPFTYVVGRHGELGFVVTLYGNNPLGRIHLGRLTVLWPMPRLLNRSFSFGLSADSSMLVWYLGLRRRVWFLPWAERMLQSKAQGDSATFTFRDVDGEVMQATCHLETTVWRVGRGAWHWLLFGKSEVKTGLYIAFSGEQGRDKGSWKGGALRVWTTAEPGQPLAQAFRAYCERERLAILSSISEVEP